MQRTTMLPRSTGAAWHKGLSLKTSAYLPSIADIGKQCHPQLMVSAWEKARRMSVRRSIGNRRDPQPVALSRGPDYLIAHACFACRKSWKVRADTGALCPQCALPLHEMGRAFKVPKKTDAEQWQKVEALWNAGFRFWAYPSPEVEPLPERLRDVPDFIGRNPNHPLRLVR
jgi:hypothetical protein